ncbi:Hypothetical protein CAP_0529 [Chondromyces apiculatus DSM 436]|uniref:DNA-binding domain-containing protein n=1 Tax=Chondromyces apiculatus DSM 436 TaxID=1192034 RepID=A0A017SV71_9BACT|nr:Hypothetical protein CAP_0529 [Chondromyces apiculatus DSM 436]
MEGNVSEISFQTAFAKLLIDGEARAAVAAGSAPGSFEISEADAARLRAIDQGRMGLYADLLVMNRLAKAVEALPCTTKALGEHLWPLTLAWNHASPPVQARKYDEAMAFGNYLLETIGSRSYEPTYLKDVLLYEMTRLELRYTTVHEPPAAQAERCPALLEELARGEGYTRVYPERAPHTRVLALDHDVQPIMEELVQGRVPTEVEPRLTYALMAVDRGGRVQPFAVNLPTAAFISAATGEASFAEVLTWLAQVFQEETPEQIQALGAGLAGLCAALVEQGVILLSDHPASRGVEPALN